MSHLARGSRHVCAAFLLVVGIAASAHAADLVVLQVDTSALIVDCRASGVTGTVAATIQNAGATGTGGGFHVLFFEDENANGAYDSGIDLSLGEAIVSGSLAPGDQVVASASISATVKFAKNLIYAFADNRGEIPETDETNNVGNSGTSCAFQPPVGTFDPVVEWAWTQTPNQPDALNVMMTPAVVDLNADGIPDVVFGSTASTGGGYVEVGYLRALSGNNGTELFTVTDPSELVNTASSVAVGDIDNDGRPEIIACSSSGNQLIAFENDGTFKWLSPPLEPINWGAPAIADLDQDGTPEIVIGRQALNNDGSIRWTGSGGTGGPAGPVSLVADVDNDGTPNVVAGNTVYSAGGAILWRNPNLPDGLTAVANFDNTDDAEIVLVSNGSVWLLNHDCTVQWGPVAIPGGGNGGPPTVADYDGDGLPEIGVAGASRYVVFETDGTIKWSAQTQDGSSNVTGSSVFDFDGDGSAEVVYRDELYLRVYRGADGTVLFQTPMSSCTWYEYVLVADVDADGNAEIVAVANNNCGYGPQRGVYVFGDANDSWVATRKIWNEHAYHITNVNENGTIPQIEQNNWLFPPTGPYNNYRQNTLPGREPLAAPNLTASRIHADYAPCPDGIGLVARIGNGGSNVAAAPVQVAFYEGDPQGGGTLLGTAPTTVNLNPGSYEDVMLILPPHFTGPRTICAVADDAGGGVGAVSECDETDNTCCADLEIGPCGPTPVLLQSALVEQRGFSVELEWSLNSDIAMAEYRIWRRTEGRPGEEIIANVPADPSGRQSYRDDSVRPGEAYIYRIESRDLSGGVLTLGDWRVVVAGPAREIIVMATPNPVRSSVSVSFDLPETRNVTLSILDPSGRSVRSYHGTALGAGRHSFTWDLRDSGGARVRAGIYPYRLDTGVKALTGKITVLP